MRQTISGLVAAVAVMAAGAAPAMACGEIPCGPVYVPAPVYSGCYSGCGWAYERLPDPVQQYYYVNQGPAYSGPGDFAPEPTYQEGSYRHHAYRYGYEGAGYAPEYRALFAPGSAASMRPSYRAQRLDELPGLVHREFGFRGNPR